MRRRTASLTASSSNQLPDDDGGDEQPAGHHEPFRAETLPVVYHVSKGQPAHAHSQTLRKKAVAAYSAASIRSVSVS